MIHHERLRERIYRTNQQAQVSSMYSIFTYIQLKNDPNVSKYTISGTCQCAANANLSIYTVGISTVAQPRGGIVWCLDRLAASPNSEIYEQPRRTTYTNSQEEQQT